MMGDVNAAGVPGAGLRVAARRKPEVGGSPCTYDVVCSECSESFQRSRRVTRYGFPLLCRACEITSE
jgi:hypothetical protein